MFKKYYLTVLNVFLLLCILSWFARFEIIKRYYKYVWFQENPEEELIKYSNVLEEDRLILSEYKIFQPSLGKNDAGPFLNPKVNWPFGEIHHQGELALPEFIHREMSKDWVIKKPLFKKMGLDFSWMSELHKFDFWDVEKNTPVFVAGKKYLTYSYPAPSYKELMTWAKLRLLYGKETGKMNEAFKDVRQLARLIWTNDTLLSSMVTVNLLKLENEIHQGNWEIIPEEILMRAKRFFYALPSMIDPRLDDSHFFKFTPLAPGICPMLNEAMLSYISVRDLLKDELKNEYMRMDLLIKESLTVCRKTIVHEMWEDPGWPTFMLTEEDDFSYVSEASFLPKKTWGEIKKDKTIKSIIGMILSTKNTYNYLSGYGESFSD